MNELLNIRDEVLKEAAECRKEQQCIKNRVEWLCKVDIFVNDNVLFVRCLDANYCSYRLPFADTFVCNCPVRKEIYNLYRA
ncbi:MAG: hypothetical protein SFH39_17545 [Candidatus Magnetobacterium sp. LHC-1]|uniref:Uncharacterized protein n=1 Tax=Candidatus Magnetobacterium casense TaxID=1455061 RepID=A0ABS6S3E3_9BACT|nr:hypothetical protein [Candidatus Magnetobacterium casensis]MBF0607937.1 hypothetical protein [Nitrospirota bacterium]MBV6342894.1 hypothetical protein [Candidatus Magnetobacterium casensis]